MTADAADKVHEFFAREPVDVVKMHEKLDKSI